MAKAVVDELEVVEVDEQHSHNARSWLLHELLNPLGEQHAVGETSQRVMTGIVTGATLVALNHRHQTRHSHDDEQEHHRRRDVQHHLVDGLAPDKVDDRHGHHDQAHDRQPRPGDCCSDSRSGNITADVGCSAAAPIST